MNNNLNLIPTNDIKTAMLEEAEVAQLNWEKMRETKERMEADKIIEVGRIFEEFIATKGWEKILNFMANRMKIENFLPNVDEPDKVVRQLHHVEAYKLLLNHIYGVINKRKELLKTKGGENDE